MSHSAAAPLLLERKTVDGGFLSRTKTRNPFPLSVVAPNLQLHQRQQQPVSITTTIMTLGSRLGSTALITRGCT